jgi:hypothetical protein
MSTLEPLEQRLEEPLVERKKLVEVERVVLMLGNNI